MLDAVSELATSTATESRQGPRELRPRRVIFLRVILLFQALGGGLGAIASIASGSPFLILFGLGLASVMWILFVSSFLDPRRAFAAATIFGTVILVLLAATSLLSPDIRAEPLGVVARVLFVLFMYWGFQTYPVHDESEKPG